MGHPFDFKGVMSALITPFKKGKVDFASYEKLVRYQLKNGIQGLVVNGTTGESPTLDKDEVKDLLECTLDLAKGKVPVLLGAGSNSTEQTIKKVKKAEKWGADGTLVVVPYYNKPPQRGLLEHFRQISESAERPVMLYNVPSRTGRDMSNEVIAKLSELPKIVGVKEASGDTSRVHDLQTKCQPGFVCLTGDDESALDFIRKGGHGIISVISNALPALSVKLSDDLRAAKPLEDQEEQRFLKACQALTVDTNPIPIKAALQVMGLIASAEVRLPLVPLEPEAASQIEDFFKAIEV